MNARGRHPHFCGTVGLSAHNVRWTNFKKLIFCWGVSSLFTGRSNTKKDNQVKCVQCSLSFLFILNWFRQSTFLLSLLSIALSYNSPPYHLCSLITHQTYFAFLSYPPSQPELTLSAEDSHLSLFIDPSPACCSQPSPNFFFFFFHISFFTISAYHTTPYHTIPYHFHCHYHTTHTVLIRHASSS